MRTALLAAVALALAAGAPAYAKNDKGHPHGGPPGQVGKGPPPGQAKKWGKGQRLPSTYIVSRYYIEPVRHRLPAPPPGYRWVGVNGDAYLVQTQTGMIRDLVLGLLG